MNIEDSTIQEGLERSGVIPEFVEWDGNPAFRVVVRIEKHIGQYVEGDLYPWMDADDVADKLRRLSERLDGHQ